MEFEGKAIEKFEASKGTSARGDWQRQEVLFEVMDGQYARKVVVSFFNKEQEINSITIGESYTVSVNIESREFNGKWYTNVNGWRVQSKQAAAPVAPAPSAMPPMPSAPIASEPSFSSSSEDVDDLPF